MAFDGSYGMTEAEMIEWEATIRHKMHRASRALKAAEKSLEEFADELAAHHGIAAANRSGGDDKPTDPPEEP